MFKQSNGKIAGGIISLAVLSLPVATYADSFGNFLGYVEDWVDNLVIIFIGFAMIAFFWGMIKFIANAGDEGKRKEGKQLMLWGVIALAVIVSIWGLVNYLQTIFNITSTETTPLPSI